MEFPFFALEDIASVVPTGVVISLQDQQNIARVRMISWAPTKAVRLAKYQADLKAKSDRRAAKKILVPSLPTLALLFSQQMCRLTPISPAFGTYVTMEGCGRLRLRFGDRRIGNLGVSL